MMKLLTVVLVILAIDYTSSVEVCQAKRGKKFVTFSRTGETLRFPCKYNAVRDTICGSYKITITPGNMLEAERGKLYIIKSMWLAVKRIATGESWEGRSELKIARKYLAGIEDAPFRQKGGALNTADLFVYGDMNADNEVSMTEKNNEFKVTFGLYDPHGDWHKSSGFTFECFHDNFQPSDYPTQLCGNGTKNEVKNFRKSLEWKDNRIATIIYNVFSNDGIVQMGSECKALATTMQDQCKTPEARYNASVLCWPIFGKRRYQTCFTENGDNIIDVFRECVHFTCTQDRDVCLELGPKLDMCPELKGVSGAVKAACFPALTPQ